MRTTLRISICLNCALLGCLAFLLLNQRPARPPAEAPAQAENPLPPSEDVTPAPGLMPLGSDYPAPSASAVNASTSQAAVETTPSGVERQPPPVVIALPLVFHEIDPEVVNLNPQQAQVVNDLREKFIQDVGGPNQDPNDPAYSQRWQASQPQADLDLCGMLGINAFQSYQIAAWAKAHDQTPSEP